MVEEEEEEVVDSRVTCGIQINYCRCEGVIRVAADGVGAVETGEGEAGY